MEYDQYLKHYKWMGLDRVESSMTFELDPSSDSGQEIERILKFYEEYHGPGVRWSREGSEWKVDLVAYEYQSHIDNFERLGIEISLATGVKPVNQSPLLGNGDTL